MCIWDLYLNDRAEEAIELAETAFLHAQHDLSLMNDLTCLHLLSRELSEAIATAERCRKASSRSTDFLFSLSGTALWCDDMLESAVSVWREGLNCDYTDAAGGITIPLHLVFSSIFQTAASPTDDCLSLVQNKIDGPYSDCWPATLGRLVLGQISYEEAVSDGEVSIEHFWGDEYECEKSLMIFKIDFWYAVRKQLIGDSAQFVQVMERLGDISVVKATKSSEYSTRVLRTTLYYLARWVNENKDRVPKKPQHDKMQ